MNNYPDFPVFFVGPKKIFVYINGFLGYFIIVSAVRKKDWQKYNQKEECFK